MRIHSHTNSSMTARQHMQRARTNILNAYYLKHETPMPRMQRKSAGFLYDQITEAFGFQAKKMTIAIPKEELNRATA